MQPGDLKLIIQNMTCKEGLKNGWKLSVKTAGKKHATAFHTA